MCFCKKSYVNFLVKRVICHLTLCSLIKDMLPKLSLKISWHCRFVLGGHYVDFQLYRNCSQYVKLHIWSNQIQKLILQTCVSSNKSSIYPILLSMKIREVMFARPESQSWFVKGLGKPVKSQQEEGGWVSSFHWSDHKYQVSQVSKVTCLYIWKPVDLGIMTMVSVRLSGYHCQCH